LFVVIVATLIAADSRHRPVITIAFSSAACLLICFRASKAGR
jgi:hypothetical protein